MLAIQTQNQISAVLGRRPCAAGQPFSVLTRGCGRPERITAALGGDPGQLQRQPSRGGSSGPEAPRSGAGSRGRAPAATMGKGSMGAVDKNMRKELSLEIDGHACPDQYVNVGIGAEITWRAPHAIDATSSPWPPTQLTG